MSIIRTLALALAIAAFGVTTAQAQYPSENGPKNYSKNSATGDYRAPADAHTADMIGAAATVVPKQDLRLPDTVDAANGSGPATAPDITVVKVPSPAPAPAPSSGGLDWTDAGIGAGGMLAMLLVAGGAALALVHRRRALRPLA